MSDKKLGEVRERTEALFKLKRAPSQETVFNHLLETGRTMTVREIAAELDLTDKSAERAVAKLLEKGLIQRSTFREGTYTCESRAIIVSLLRVVTTLFEEYEERS
ncbi:MarR family transcriptional regulator [Candidatus Bathyarchaeota archaeon]|nr:MarR family transcriptional regulator [Candidatus Bathyarchaeota archaeon]